MQQAVAVVAEVVRVVAVAVAVLPLPCGIGRVIVRSDYVQQTTGYFNVKLHSSSQTGVHLQCCLLKLLKLHVCTYTRFSFGLAGTVIAVCSGCTFNLTV